MIQPFGNLGHPRLGIFLNRSSQYSLPRVPFALTPGVGNTAKALSERNHPRWAGRAALVKRNGSGGQLHGCGQQRSALSPWLLVLPAVLARPCLLCPVPPPPPQPEGAEMLAAGSRSFPPSLLRSVRALAKPAWTAKGSGEPGAVPAARQSHLTPHRAGRLPGAGAAADASARCRQPLTCLKELPSPCSSCPSPAASASAAHIAPGWGPAIAPLRSPPHAPRSLPSPRSPAACALCIASTALRSPPATRQRRSPAPGQSRAPAAQPPLPAPSPSEGKAPGRLTNLSCPCSPSSSAPLFSASSAPRACLSRTGPRREQSLHPRASRQLGCGSRGHLSPSPNNSWRANKILKKPKKRPCGRATPASSRLQPSG